MFHQPAAHSDADTIVFFRRADVVVAGDLLDLRHCPVIDLDSGGTIDTYVNGSRKEAGHYGGGLDNHYFKYGVYGTLNTSSAKSEWRNVKYFKK